MYSIPLFVGRFVLQAVLEGFGFAGKPSGPTAWPSKGMDFFVENKKRKIDRHKREYFQ